MARIRTIKPEFWTDEKIVQLPFEARLLFIGLWNFCDDDGFLFDEPDRIRMQVMPNDEIDASELIDLLVAAELIERFVLNDGRPCLCVTRFKTHQKISHASPSRIAPEISRKLAIPAESRRKVAKKYGCTPGGRKVAECYMCGAPGSIWWPPLKSGRPGWWVAFSNLELSHVEPESGGGSNTSENLVLCCRGCNRSTATSNAISRILQRVPEDSGGLRPEGKGMEGNGKEEEQKRNGKEGGSGESPREQPKQEPNTPQLKNSKSFGLPATGLGLAALFVSLNKGKAIYADEQASIGGEIDEMVRVGEATIAEIEAEILRDGRSKGEKWWQLKKRFEEKTHASRGRPVGLARIEPSEALRRKAERKEAEALHATRSRAQEFAQDAPRPNQDSAGHPP